MASQTDGDTSRAGRGDEGAAGVAAPAIALGAWMLLTPATFSGTVLAAFALARTAGRTQLEATVMRRAKVRKVHALPERRGFLAMLAPRLMAGATARHYVTGVAQVGVPAFATTVLGALVRTAPYAVLGQLATILVAGASIAVGAVTAAVLVRRLRTPLPPPELRLSLPESEGGGRAVARPPPQPGELRYIAWAAA